MRARGLIFVLLLMSLWVPAAGSAITPEVEVTAHVSREDVRQITRVVRARTREPVFRIYPIYFERGSTRSDREIPDQVSAQTGDPLRQVSGGSYFLKKREGTWRIVSVSHWIR